jgi:opacity protein-like surface antigen
MKTKIFVAALLAFHLTSHANAWNMDEDVETEQTKNEVTASTPSINNTTTEQGSIDSSMAFSKAKRAEYKKQKRIDNLYHTRSGFYFSSELSIGYTSLRTSEDYYQHDEKDVSKFSGLAFPYFEVRLGYHFTNAITTYGAIGIGLGAGDFESTSREFKRKFDDKAKIDAAGIRGLLGFGAEFYPFQDKESALNGMFFGLCVGLAAENVQENNYDGFGFSYDSKNKKLEHFDNVFARAEVGYDFWISSRWRMGAAFSYTFGKYDSDDEDNIVTTSHNFSLAFRIAR